MGFQITFDVSPLEKQLNAMLKQLQEFPQEMNKEFLEWQGKDMHRRQPESTVAPDGVETIITPRGVRQASHKMITSSKPRIPTVRRAGGGARTRRPILREELFEMLTKRMDELLDKELNWAG